MSNRIALDKAYDYLLSGKATVTFWNTQSGKQFTFYIKQKATVWYVYNNFDYIGYIRGDVFIPNNDLKTVTVRAKALEVFTYIWKKIVDQTLQDFIWIQHDGRCGKCHRQLTDVISIETGIGPECRRKLGITTPPIKKHDTISTGRIAESIHATQQGSEARIDSNPS